eukprot:s968_g9.t1
MLQLQRFAVSDLNRRQATLERERQQLRVAQEAQAAAGADLRQLEENSRLVLANCPDLQQKVRELELELAAFLEVQAKSEEERKAMMVGGTASPRAVAGGSAQIEASAGTCRGQSKTAEAATREAQPVLEKTDIQTKEDDLWFDLRDKAMPHRPIDASC